MMTKRTDVEGALTTNAEIPHMRPRFVSSDQMHHSQVFSAKRAGGPDDNYWDTVNFTTVDAV